MHKSATKCNETIGKWCKNKHGASKIIDTFETYQEAAGSSAGVAMQFRDDLSARVFYSNGTSHCSSRERGTLGWPGAVSLAVLY
jgi:hypothetical protein